MHRFIVPRERGFRPGDLVELPREEARHALRVLRLREGDETELIDGAGGVYRARLADGRQETVRLAVLGRLEDREAPVSLTLYMGLPKAEKLELIAQKLTELGGARLVPVVMSRSVARPDGRDGDRRQERLQRIAQEAVKQCGRGRVPEMEAPLPWKQALDRMSRHELTLVPWEEAGGTRLCGLRNQYPEAKDIALLIGPEGGIASEEAEEAAARGAHLLTLGPRILRAETAAVAASAVVMALWGDC